MTASVESSVETKETLYPLARNENLCFAHNTEMLMKEKMNFEALLFLFEKEQFSTPSTLAQVESF